MKNVISLLSLGLIVLLLTGCGTTQNIAEPNMKKPIPKDKIIVILTRESSMAGGAYSHKIYSNGVEIGKLGSGGELKWSSESNKPVCIAISFTGKAIEFEKEPVTYSCYTAKPGHILKLQYSPMEWLHKKSKTDVITNKYAIGKIVNNSKVETENDLVSLLKSDMKKALTEKGNMLITNPSSNDKTIELVIHEYNEGNAGARWAGVTKDGSSIVAITAKVKQNGKVIDTYKIKNVISEGGFFTIGGDTTVITEAAKNIANYLAGNY